MNRNQIMARLGDLTRVPLCIEQLLSLSGQYEKIARANSKSQSFFCLGRGLHYPIALEGALKLKEISHVHAEGIPAGEVRHGAHALIDANLPVIVLAARDPGSPKSMLRYEEMLLDMEDVRTRDGNLIVLATEGDTRVSRYSNQVIYLPELSDCLIPLLLTIPLQLLAYHLAVQKGLDVDQPRSQTHRMAVAM
jgi:glucosamine--fructose-6-phosphate aminotransferase (isomerizing)